MRKHQSGWPSRSTVEEVWRAVAAGARSREDAHDWTVPWVEGDAAHEPSDDLMVPSGLQHIHGLDMAYRPDTPHLIHHGPPGIYMRTLDMIRADLEAWLDDCRDYDEDPVRYLHVRHERARAALRAEREKRRQRREEGAGDDDPR